MLMSREDISRNTKNNTWTVPAIFTTYNHIIGFSKSVIYPIYSHLPSHHFSHHQFKPQITDKSSRLDTTL